MQQEDGEGRREKLPLNGEPLLHLLLLLEDGEPPLRGSFSLLPSPSSCGRSRCSSCSPLRVSFSLLPSPSSCSRSRCSSCSPLRVSFSLLPSPSSCSRSRCS